MSNDAPLTPAEAAVLLAPNLGNGAAAVKATLLFLLVTGVLRMETVEEPGFFRRRKVARLKIAAAPKNAPPEVAVLLDLVRAAEAEGGKVKDVAKRAQKAFGAGCPQFSVKFILPALVARGLLAENKILFVKTFRLTTEGRRAQARVKSDLVKAGEIARLAKSDPQQAAALAKTLGVHALLSDKLTKQFKPLAEAMRMQDGGDSAVADFASSRGGFDFSHFDLGGFDLGHFDAGAIDAIHAGFDSFDAGFSDGGGDSGGHDGGGHH